MTREEITRIINEKMDTAMSRVVVLKLVGLASGERSVFDGQYVKEYDPTRHGRSPDGRAMIAHLVTVEDPREALRLDFMEAWRMVHQSHGVRDDGAPNRPLRAFHISYDNAPEG